MAGWFLAQEAEEDLLQIHAYTQEFWGGHQADAYVRALFEAFARIGENPQMGRLRPELGRGLRSFPHGSHIVFFMEWNEEVAIVRVLHGSRDIAGVFGEDKPSNGIPD